MKYLVIDAFLNGTGIRDKYNGGFIDPKELGLSSNIITRIEKWLINYENEHYDGYANEQNISSLDQEGKEIALLIRKELAEVKIEYFSDARMISELIF
ncbi:MAG: hypothetical protein K0M56_02255 [Kaistella sp.]|nr:hypothetical protein [Kaistella sp.]